MTIEQIQAAIDAKADARQIINMIADYIQANPGGDSGYLVYTALISQTGTNAPTAVVIKNTIGDIVWSRFGEGIYFATLAGAFIENKTWYCIRGGNGDDASDQHLIQRLDVDRIQVLTMFLTVSTGYSSYDDGLNSEPIEIRVYQ